MVYAANRLGSKGCIVLGSLPFAGWFFCFHDKGKLLSPCPFLPDHLINTQQHIHHKLLEKAKGKLAGTTLTVAEIAYELGFEHPQSLSRLFKLKTKLSPLEFRQSFN